MQMILQRGSPVEHTAIYPLHRPTSVTVFTAHAQAPPPPPPGARDVARVVTIEIYHGIGNTADAIERERDRQTQRGMEDQEVETRFTHDSDVKKARLKYITV